MKVAPTYRALEPHREWVSHAIIHTGQHYSAAMSDAFFADLEMPEPAKFLDAGSGTHAEQTAKIMVRFKEICLDNKPDLVLVAGDVDSTIACALTAAKCGIRVGHIEAGLRSFDRAMREEIVDLLDKPRKKGALPPRWDGKTAERIVDTIVKQIR